ncbi:cytokine receptor [Leptidea sinapis]|uniref:Fibronectin type-III domain-containing protein n=1 Tax=Leptidea sinapis TaxID=189913 RepID=A0A5E4QNJ4_9NEOP|nr:cytokine receptor [Leptidea sinapis]VVC99201.1 unnamed protein product [Leptidea sinapis]
MADCSVNRSKKKCCSFSRNGFQLQPWFWCLLLQCLTIPCILSKCLNVDITVAVYPQGEIRVRYGDPLEIFCVAENNYTSSDIEFTLAGKHVDSEIINSTTRRLYMRKPDKQVNAYYCRNNKTNKICTTRVLVDSPPADITDFNCLSNNMEILNCSWSYPENLSSINYSLTFSTNGNIVTPSCLAQRVENTNTKFCVWNTTSQPRYRQQEVYQYFYLTSCNVFGCNYQNFTIDHYSIVKPEPPSELRVVKNGTHSVVLKWSVPHNVVDFLLCGVEHIIEYQIAKIDNTTYFHRVDTSALPPRNKTYKFQLSNLPFAHMQYEVRIYIKSKRATKREFWSDYSYTVFYTASERPNRPPDMIAGAFNQGTFNDRRVINVYWKQLEEYEEAGANFTYKVLVQQDNNTQTIFADKNKSLSYVKLNVSENALDVTVWSFNMNGSSLNSSHLYIPPEKDIHSLGLASFTKLAYENGTYELSWVGIKNIDNYTLFWCQHNSTQICNGRMDFAVLDPQKSRHVIDLPREYRFQFAISANNGTKTSGMVWAKCDISRDGFVMYGFPVKLDYDVPGKTFVVLRWIMDCALQEGIITGYNISYCPIVRTSSYCDKSVESKHVFIPNPRQMYVKIEHLLPYRTYQFTLSLSTIYGQKNIENATTVLTTSEDTPTSPVNVVISDVKNDSLVIEWNPPVQRNGNIGKYVIYNYDKKIYVDTVSETDTSRKITLTGLQGFTNYSLTVQACNMAINSCSKVNPNDAVFVRTRIAAPSRLKAPTVKNNPDMLKWEPPVVPGGTVDLYQIRRIKDDGEPEILNTTNLMYTLIHCEGVVSTETYQVRAVNFDEDLYHGVIGQVAASARTHQTIDEYPGPWSEPSTVACRSRDGLAMIFIIMAIFVLVAIGYGSFKLYKKYRKMEDIKPVLPYGLGEPEKDRTKFSYPDWNPSSKDEKPSSDEMLLLPNSIVTSSDTKNKDDNCAASDHTDSTALSDSTRAPVDRQASTSDDGSNSSLHLEGEADKADISTVVQDDSSNVDTESSCENSPYLSDKDFKKNPASGYVQQVVNPAKGYVRSAPPPIKNPQPVATVQPASSGYVMAGLTPPMFGAGAASKATVPAPSSGYVLPEEAQQKSTMNFSNLTQALPKLQGPENLPSLPTLPPPVKPNSDSSYIQLQSLDSLSSLKPSVRNTVPLKQPTSSGYVSPGDMVINKHLNNMLSAGQVLEESAILDPTMSPDAYCRFSWSTDPANDNLHSLLADPSTRNVPKN